MKKVVILFIALLIVSIVCAQNTTYTLFYGKVNASATTIVARVNEHTFVANLSNDQYGYDPEFRVEGIEGEPILFFVNGKLVGNASIVNNGFIRKDFGYSEQTTKNLSELTSIVKNTHSPLQQSNTLTLPVKKQFETVQSASWTSWLIFLLLLLVGASVFFYWNRLQVQKDPLKKYVQSMLSQGYSKEQINQILLSKGWNPETIKRVMQN